MNSWNDVNLQYSDDGNAVDLTMHCGPDYLSSCDVSSSWSGCAHSTDYCSIDEDDQVLLPTANETTNTGNTSMDDWVDPHLLNATMFSAVLFVDDGDSLDIMFIGAWVLAFGLGWLVCGLIRWKCKQTVREKQEEHVRQQTAQHLAQFSNLSLHDIQAILNVTNPGQNVRDLMDGVDGHHHGDHNPDDSILRPNFDESDDGVVPDRMPGDAPYAHRVPTTTHELDSTNPGHSNRTPLARMYSEDLEITPPSQDAPDPPPYHPSPSPALSDYAE